MKKRHTAGRCATPSRPVGTFCCTCTMTFGAASWTSWSKYDSECD